MLLRDVAYNITKNGVREKRKMNRGRSNNRPVIFTDYGSEPFVINIDTITGQNPNFRTALWTGEHLQLTLMSIPVGGEIGLEMHPDTDQFLRIEEGFGLVRMGTARENLNLQRNVQEGFAVFVPAGTWHNLLNIGNRPIKLYSIYAPPEHPKGTAQTKAD
jgi:mannose-6-phosphate isomerase-like protein (cupin superfamily)